MTARRARILDAAVAVLAKHGMDGWSMERVAQAADCAKGLVHYHFRSRDALLAAVGQTLAARRIERREQALAPRGTAALDALWRVLREDTRDGRAAAWLVLGLNGASAVRQAMMPPAPLLDRFAAAAGVALEGEPLASRSAHALLLVLDGFEAALVRGAPEADVREAYDRVWLAMLG